jgi:hypothetical protein
MRIAGGRKESGKWKPVRLRARALRAQDISDKHVGVLMARLFSLSGLRRSCKFGTRVGASRTCQPYPVLGTPRVCLLFGGEWNFASERGSIQPRAVLLRRQRFNQRRR